MRNTTWSDPISAPTTARRMARPLSIEFDVVYMLQRREGGPKIFAFVAGDEMALYRQYGLVDEEGKPA